MEKLRFILTFLMEIWERVKIILIFEILSEMGPWTRILVQDTIYIRLQIGQGGHPDQSEAYDIS